MFGGINPKQMQGMMKKMGIEQADVDASKVIIEKNNGNKIIIENPSVTKIKMQGQETFQVVGDVSEVEGESFNEEDIKTVMEKTGVSEEKAKVALEENNGDLAETILSLS